MTIRFEETSQPPSRLLGRQQSSSASSSLSSSAGLRSYRDAALSPRPRENGEDKSGATMPRTLSTKQPKGSGGDCSGSPISIVDRKSSSKGPSPSPSPTPSTTTKRKKSGNGGKSCSRSRRRRSFQPPSVCDDSDTISTVSSSSSSSSDSDSSTNSNSGNRSATSAPPSTPRAKRIAGATSSPSLPKQQQQQPKSKKSVHFSTPLVTQIYTRPYTLADDIPILFYSAQDEERFRAEYYRDSYNDQSHSEDICGATFDVDLDAIVSDDEDGVISDLTSEEEEEESEEELNEDTNKKENLPSLEGDNLSFLSLSPPPLQINDNNSKKAKRSKEYVISKAVVIHDGKIQTYYDDDILMIPAPTLDTTTADNSNLEQETLQPFFTTNKTMPVITNQCGAEAYAETKTAAAATVHHFFDNFDFWNGTVTWY